MEDNNHTLDWNGRCWVRSDGKRFYWRQRTGAVVVGLGFVEIGTASTAAQVREIALSY